MNNLSVLSSVGHTRGFSENTFFFWSLYCLSYYDSLICLLPFWHLQTFLWKTCNNCHSRFKLYFCWFFFFILVLIVKQMPLFQFEDKCGMVLLQDNFVWLRDLFLISYIKHKNRTTHNSYCFYCFELFLNGLLYYFLFVAKERVYLVVQTLKLCSTIINNGWDEVAPLMQCKFC
jgi:hypothetical protein